MTIALEKDEDEMDYEIEKQKRIITKDWTGERNEKIGGVQKKLVEKMAERLNKPKMREMAINTDIKFVTLEEHERVQYLNQ